MSYIDSSIIEENITDASMNRLEAVLKDRGYKVVRTKLQITATLNSFWTSKNSIITITDCGNYRSCKDIETAKGMLNRPNSGVLASIVAEAEAE
jgi:hypothetical protein